MVCPPSGAYSNKTAWCEHAYRPPLSGLTSDDEGARERDDIDRRLEQLLAGARIRHHRKPLTQQELSKQAPRCIWGRALYYLWYSTVAIRCGCGSTQRAQIGKGGGHGLA